MPINWKVCKLLYIDGILKLYSEDHIASLIDRRCLQHNNVSTADGNFTSQTTTYENPKYIHGEAIPNDDVTQSVYACTECVPLPYEGILPPNALDWYSPLHWWDFASITVALAVQFRLKTIDDVS